jgi:hypothetical protein
MGGAMLNLLLICVLIGVVVKLGHDLSYQENVRIVDVVEHDEAADD